MAEETCNTCGRDVRSPFRSCNPLEVDPMTTDTAPAVPVPVPAPLTLQQRHEKAAAALALVRELQSDTTTHGDFATFRGGRWYASLEAAFTAIHTAAYYAEYALTMDQVEARA